MRSNLLVYLSGPMTDKDGRTIEQNTADGVALYLELLKHGIPAFCPHLSGAFPSAWTTLSHADWLAYDFAIIDRCTHMLMMERWQTSAGAQREHDYAFVKGVPVFYDLERLLAHVDAQAVSD